MRRWHMGLVVSLTLSACSGAATDDAAVRDAAADPGLDAGSSDGAAEGGPPDGATVLDGARADVALYPSDAPTYLAGDTDLVRRDGAGATDAGAAPTCTSTELAELLAPATDEIEEHLVRCSATLPAGSTVTKRLVFEGEASSGVTLDCAGGTLRPTFGDPDALLIRSRVIDPTTWEPAHHITVARCTIEGSMRILGMGANGQAEANRISSRTPGHTARAQAAAPHDVVLRELTLIGAARIPLYLAPGVTRTTLVDSEVRGMSRSVAIYLDAESAENVIERNYIHVTTDVREQIAIDGSAYNVIAENRFDQLTNGGIYVYRNCGEGGATRWQPPTDNHFLGNAFEVGATPSAFPLIWIGSRQGLSSFCPDDDGIPYGSSIDDDDYAERNVIAGNRLVTQLARSLFTIFDGPTLVSANRRGLEVGGPVPRGCVVTLPGDARFYLPVGASRVVADGAGFTRHRCMAGGATTTSPETGTTTHEARCTGDGFCEARVGCAAGETLVGVRAACGLDAGGLSEASFGSVSPETLAASGTGTCGLGGLVIDAGTASTRGLVDALDAGETPPSFAATCASDEGCEARVEVRCAPPSTGT